MSSYEIRSDIPIPGTSKRYTMYGDVLDALKVGDSFEVECPKEKEENRKKRQQVSVAIARHAARAGKKFMSRKTRNGVRVWRIA